MRIGAVMFAVMFLDGIGRVPFPAKEVPLLVMGYGAVELYSAELLLLTAREAAVGAEL
jgi:hypothetical protein